MQNIGLIGKKIGMSREFFPIGISVPVTVIKIEKGRVIDLIRKDKRGYDAIKVGFGKIKTSKLTKSMKGFYSKKSTEPKKYLKEYRVEDLSNFKEGNEIGLEIFKNTKFVDVTSKTIGKGFAGVMKKYNFSGLRATQGVSISHRTGESTGQRQDPGRVFKGKKMPGHMGNKFRTMLNLEVIKSDLDNDLIFLKGSIPGSKNTLVFIKNSVKKINKKTIFEKNKIAIKVEEKRDIEAKNEKTEKTEKDTKKKEGK
jgi:large subunit ribosomal protein L3